MNHPPPPPPPPPIRNLNHEKTRISIPRSDINSNRIQSKKKQLHSDWNFTLTAMSVYLLTHFDHTIIEFAAKAVQEHNAKYEKDQLKFLKVAKGYEYAATDLLYKLFILAQDGAQNLKLYVAEVLNKNEAHKISLETFKVEDYPGSEDFLVQVVKEYKDSETKRAREEEEEEFKKEKFQKLGEAAEAKTGGHSAPL